MIRETARSLAAAMQPEAGEEWAARQAAWAEYERLRALRQMRNRVAATPTAGELRRAGDTVTRARMGDPDTGLDTLERLVRVAMVALVALCGLNMMGVL